jgi:trans-aconitate methyltransferase|tara:strand:- start:384 stop:1004 length:621 start_codon:yes stop_codon:yes gene_type:complete
MRKAVDVFGEWATKGKDEGMEKSHSIPVNEMLDFALGEIIDEGKSFDFLDLGCGNGWVVRQVAQHSLCRKAFGIDGAPEMIANAEDREGNAEYILADLNKYDSNVKYDLVHSMEVLYYLENPFIIIEKIANSWLNLHGRLIVGVDHYYENESSHSWQEKVGTRMLMFKEEEWIEAFTNSGLSQVESWRANKGDDWEGTLVITGIKI